jgi:hypothetical protein
MLGDIRHSRSFDARADVVPTDGRSKRMLVRVESIAGLVGEVDPAHERDAVVDDDRLLVVTVERPFLRVEATLDVRATRQLFVHLSRVTSGGSKQRQRSPRPGQDPDLHAVGKTCEEVSKDDLLLVTHESKVRREVPTREVDV